MRASIKAGGSALLQFSPIGLNSNVRLSLQPLEQAVREKHGFGYGDVEFCELSNHLPAILISPPGRGRLSHKSAERPCEVGFRFIADFQRNGCYGWVVLAQQIHSHLQPPLCEALEVREIVDQPFDQPDTRATDVRTIPVARLVQTQRLLRPSCSRSLSGRFLGKAASQLNGTP